MLTKNDLKQIGEIVDKKVNYRISSAMKTLHQDMIDLFNPTNERIDKAEEKLTEKIDGVDKRLTTRIDKVLEKLDEHNDFLNDHERRIEKIEEKVFTTTP